MSGDELFANLPVQKGGRVNDPGQPRMREPVRDQIELRPVDLEALVAAEHPVRVIWAYVEKLDLREVEDAIQARAHTPGQAPASPRLLLALWLYATSEGVVLVDDMHDPRAVATQEADHALARLPTRRDLLDLLTGRAVTDLEPSVLAALASLDGATVTDTSGALIAAGAILRSATLDAQAEDTIVEGARTTAALSASRCVCRAIRAIVCAKTPMRSQAGAQVRPPPRRSPTR